MNASRIVGFDRTIKLEWMDATVGLAMQGYPPEEINRKLDEFLLDQIKGKDARRKTRTVLLAIWAKTKKHLLTLRADAFELFKHIPSENRIAVHWGMSMAVHPFFGYTAGITGRLINLQGTASGVEVQRRMQEMYGERQTVSRAVQRLLRTFVYWGVLKDTSEQSVYALISKIPISDTRLISWLVEVFLHASGNSSGVIKNILGSSSFFPFDIKSISSMELGLSGRLDIIPHGLDEDLVILRENHKLH